MILCVRVSGNPTKKHLMQNESAAQVICLMNFLFLSLRRAEHSKNKAEHAKNISRQDWREKKENKIMRDYDDDFSRFLQDE